MIKRNLSDERFLFFVRYAFASIVWTKSRKVRFVVMARCFGIVDEWYYDSEEKAREKFAELAAKRSDRWEIEVIRETSRQGSGSHG